MSEPRWLRLLSPAAEARRRRARILTWLNDWQTGDHPCDEDPSLEALVELGRAWQAERRLLGAGIPGDWPHLVALVQAFLAVPDADELLEIAALLEGHAQRIEAQGRSVAHRAPAHEPLLEYAPAPTLTLN